MGILRSEVALVEPKINSLRFQYFFGGGVLMDFDAKKSIFRAKW